MVIFGHPLDFFFYFREQDISRKNHLESILKYFVIKSPRDWGSDGFPLHDSFLFSLREERDLVVHVLEDNENRGLTGQLLGSIILKCFTVVELAQGGGEGGVLTSTRMVRLYSLILSKSRGWLTFTSA